jgi:hypothetical protein
LTIFAGPCTWYEDGTPAEEGSIVGGNFVPQGSVYDGSGVCTITGLTAGKTYNYSQGANDTSLDNGAQTLTDTGLFNSYNGTATLHGTPGAAVTATVRGGVYITIDQMMDLFLMKSEENAAYRFRNGQIQLPDEADGGWRGLGCKGGQAVFGDVVP